MEYVKYIWIHNFEDEPILIYSELDNERNETRKVEFYKNGKTGCATDRMKHHTFLGLESMPSIEQINEFEEFFAIPISNEEFEIVWKENAQKIIEKVHQE
ncbi:hypothetical protein DWC20_08835 [Clostridium botulinum]|uniref:DUF6881 domain-containing protein n=1 Tax=Clostridium TaxID=1485 RepID=UPI00036EC598|nr:MULTISPECIES: hypothetical protein [Clostridium]MBN1035649.1 hypothetical protein [Clostridium botulinum]NFO12252.1 hypothetical protein [Clostridium botulinum]